MNTTRSEAVDWPHDERSDQVHAEQRIGITYRWEKSLALIFFTIAVIFALCISF